MGIHIYIVVTLSYIAMKTDKIIRMRLSTYRLLRSYFPAERGESMSSYFKRLSEFLMWKNIESEVYKENE